VLAPKTVNPGRSPTIGSRVNGYLHLTVLPPMSAQLLRGRRGGEGGLAALAVGDIRPVDHDRPRERQVDGVTG